MQAINGSEENAHVELLLLQHSWAVLDLLVWFNEDLERRVAVRKNLGRACWS